MSQRLLRLMPPAIDLPRPGYGLGGNDGPDNRWTPLRKEEVVKAVHCGQISIATAERDYALSFEEFLSWATAFDTIGLRGLRAIKGLAEMRRGTRYRPPSQALASRGRIEPRAPASVSLARVSLIDGERHG